MGMEMYIVLGVVVFVLVAVLAVYITKYRTVGPDEGIDCNRKLFRH